MRITKTVVVSLVVLAALTVAPAQATERPLDRVFEPFQELLDRHLIERDFAGNGLVSAFDYQQALKRESTSGLLERQREALANFDTDTLDSRERANAFWINAYNFFMVAHLLQERPDGELVASVWDYGGRYNPLRDNVFQRELFTVDGEDYSLDGIEKGTLFGDAFRDRGWMEARVHFAVNCAAAGCPPLRATVYTADNLDALLTENTRRAFNTPVQLEVDGDTLRISKLFDWYQQDFADEEGSVRDFIRAYAEDEVAEAVAATTRITYIDYDWSLNTPANVPGIAGE